MSEKTPRSLAELMFRPGSAIGDLAQKAAAAEDLATRLRKALDPALAQALRAARVREDGTLVLMAESPAWAARLRFEAPRLLEACRSCAPTARCVQVRVAGSAKPEGS